MVKIYGFLSIIISISALINAKGINPIDFLYANREYFSKNYQVIQSVNPEGVQQKLFDSLNSLPLNVWYKNEASIIERLIAASYSYGIKDSLTVLFLISILDYPDPRPPITIQPDNTSILNYFGDKKCFNWVANAMIVLLSSATIPVLQHYHSIIRQKLENCKEPEIDKLRLLGYSVKSEDEIKYFREKLLKYYDYGLYNRMYDDLKIRLHKEFVNSPAKMTEEQTKIFGKRQVAMNDSLNKLERLKDIRRNNVILSLFAKAGDKNALGILLENYKKDPLIVEPLLFTGLDTCLKIVINNFDKRVLNSYNDNYQNYSYEIDKKYLCSSKRIGIIYYLARYYPDDSIFQPGKMEMISKGEFYLNTSNQNNYAKEFCVWANRKFDLKLNYDYNLSGPLSYAACSELEAINYFTEKEAQIKRDIDRARNEADIKTEKEYYEGWHKKYWPVLLELKKKHGLK